MFNCLLPPCAECREVSAAVVRVHPDETHVIYLCKDCAKEYDFIRCKDCGEYYPEQSVNTTPVSRHYCDNCLSDHLDEYEPAPPVPFYRLLNP